MFLIPVYSCYMICLTRYDMFGMWHATEVAYWECVMWDVRDVGCGMLGMWDVGDVGCAGCWMFEMWDFGMWDIWDVGCGMFAGMWDVDLQNTLWDSLLLCLWDCWVFVQLVLCFCWCLVFVVMKMSSGLYLHWQVCMLKLLLPRCLVFVFHVFFLKSCCLILLLA